MLARDAPNGNTRGVDPSASASASAEAPIFVVGTGRSGTTLMRQMLDAHPRIHVTHEASPYFYLSLAPRGLPIETFLERYFDTFSFRWLRIDPTAVRAELPSDSGRAVRPVDAVRAVLKAKARRRGKPRWGEKDPLLVMSLDRIFREFAEPRVIHLVRDPRATVQSLTRMPWSSESLLLNSVFCRIQLALLSAHADRILEVRLEDLLADPRSVMRSVLDFVGEPWDEAVLDHVHHASRDDVAPLPWYRTATEQPLQRAPPLEPSSGPNSELVEALNKATILRHGYPLSAAPRTRRALLSAARELPEIARSLRRALAYTRRIRRHLRGVERFDPEEAFKASVALNPGAWRHYPGFVLPALPGLPGRST
jgi:hypothetical protein